MPVILASLHFQTRSGWCCRGAGPGPRSAAGAALRAGRLAIRQRGYTLLQAWAALHGLPGAPPAARLAWRAAERVVWATWHRLAPSGCPRPPEIRLVLAVRRRA